MSDQTDRYREEAIKIVNGVKKLDAFHLVPAIEKALQAENKRTAKAAKRKARKSCGPPPPPCLKTP